MSYVTVTNITSLITYIVVILSYNTEKNIEDSRCNVKYAKLIVYV